MQWTNPNLNPNPQAVPRRAGQRWGELGDTEHSSWWPLPLSRPSLTSASPSASASALTCSLAISMVQLSHIETLIAFAFGFCCRLQLLPRWLLDNGSQRRPKAVIVSLHSWKPSPSPCSCPCHCPTRRITIYTQTSSPTTFAMITFGGC